MKKFFQNCFDKIALFILRPALIVPPEEQKRVFGVSTDDSVVLERLPVDRTLLTKVFVQAKDTGTFQVLGIDDEDGTVTILHVDSGVLHELSLDTFELLFVQVNATTA